MTKSATPSPEAIKAWARLMRVSRELIEQAEEALKTRGSPPLAWYDVLHELVRGSIIVAVGDIHVVAADEADP